MAENNNTTGLSPRQTLNGQRLLRISGSAIKICTWNVNTMYQAGKIHNAIEEMDRLKIDILGISEMRWPNSGKCEIRDHTVHYSGIKDGKHQHGVGVIVNKKISKFVKNFVPISERVLLLQIDCAPMSVNVVQVYAPTADSSDEEIESFYEDLIHVIKSIPKKDLTIIMGDFNAKVGKGRVGEIVGPYGLGERNERGDRLCNFCEEYQMVVTNTFFKLHPRRLYTWKSPKDSPNQIIRNQIDYIMINKRFRNSVISVKTYPGADIASDHNPLVGVIKARLKIMKQKTNTKYDWKKLKNPTIQSKIREELKDKFKVNEMSHENKKELEKLEKTIETTSQTHLKNENEKKKEWMTDEILKLMQERRKVKNTDASKYRRLHFKIKEEIRMAKEAWAQQKCEEIEKLQNQHDHFRLHQKVKETAGIYRSRIIGKIVDNHDKVVIDKKQRLEIWGKYIEELFEDNRPTPLDTPIDEESGLSITESEVQNAIKHMKDGKAPGPDSFRSEFLKLMDEEGIRWLTKMFNRIYDSGEIPQEWLKSEFIILPKKPGAKSCGDYRTISLMSHLLKVFLKIIHKRIYRMCEEGLTETQFGFRDALGTREALFAIQVLFQRCRDVNCDIFACFIDYQKAFDRVQHGKLIKILQQLGLGGKDRRIITNLYWNQVAHVRVEGDVSEELEIRRGVRQGCVLSPLLFNVYSEKIFEEALYELDEGILVNGERLNNIRYADDTVVFADSMEGLQRLMDRVVESSSKYGLDLNINKTKYMIISKNTLPARRLIVKNEEIKRVGQYIYLGTVINDQWDNSQEIKCRIEKARSAFVRMKTLFTSRDLTLDTKVRLLRCYVFSVLLYGVETWTLTEASCKKLEAFEMWLYRRMLRISWKQKKTNHEVLQRMKKETEIMKTVKIRKLQYLGHIMRNPDRYGLLQRILQGKVVGRRSPGRRRISWLKNLRTWFASTTTGLFRAAVNKVLIARMVANIQSG